MLGIAYWRRKAREVDAPIWFVDSENPDPEQRSYEPRQMQDAEREAYGVFDGDIAAICNDEGNVMGLMPHPEDHVTAEQHPRYTRGEIGEMGLALFEQGVLYAAGL